MEIVEQGEIVKDLLPKDPTIITTNVSFYGNKQGIGNISAQQQSQNVAATKVYVVKRKTINLLVVLVNGLKGTPYYDCFKQAGITVQVWKCNYNYHKTKKWNKLKMHMLKWKFIVTMDLNLENYDYIQFVLPGTWSTESGYVLGLADEIGGKYSWVLSNADRRTPPHELGHCMGLRHIHDEGFDDNGNCISPDICDKDALMSQSRCTTLPSGKPSTKLKLRLSHWMQLHNDNISIKGTLK